MKQVIRLIVITIFFSILAGNSVSYAMPQPSVVCQTLLEITGGTAPKNNPSPSDLDDIVRDAEAAAPTTQRLSEVIADLSHPRTGERNFIFKFEFDEFGATLIQLRNDLEKNDLYIARAVKFQHVTIGLGMPFWPAAHWIKRARGLPTGDKDSVLLEGWAALGTMVVGIGAVATQNPILNVDRYIQLELQKDRQIYADLERLEVAIAKNQKSFDHISRDFIVNKDFLRVEPVWGKESEKVTLNAEDQALADTKPLLQRVFGAIISTILNSNQTKQKVSVKVDLLTNPGTRRAAVVVRTKVI